MQQISEVTGLTPSTLSKIALGASIMFVMFGFFSSYITCVVCVAYPTFKSFLALEAKDSKIQQKQWLTYWVIFGLFNIIDQFAGFILHYIPFYYFLKLCFLVALFHPMTNGATVFYEWYIAPNYDELDAAFKAAECAVGDHVNSAQHRVSELAKDGINLAKEKISKPAEAEAEAEVVEAEYTDEVIVVDDFVIEEATNPTTME